jgi:hypothetical protein
MNSPTRTFRGLDPPPSFGANQIGDSRYRSVQADLPWPIRAVQTGEGRLDDGQGHSDKKRAGRGVE